MNPDLGDFLHDALDQVEHDSGVASFYHRFTAIKDLVVVAKPWLPESYFSTRFTYGLRSDYQLFVLRFRPITVLAAYRLATIYEESQEPDFPLQSRKLGSPQPTTRAEFEEFLHDALDRIEHNSSVEEFFHRFESIKKLVLIAKPGLTESYFASRFVYGLEKEYQIFVLRFKPLTIAVAYRLALLYEESIYLQYFPELESPHTALQEKNSDAEISLVVPSVDRASEVLMVEDFSAESIRIDSPRDIYQSVNTPVSLEVAIEEYMDNTFFNVVYQQSMSTCEVMPICSLMDSVELSIVGAFTDEAPVRKSECVDVKHNNVVVPVAAIYSISRSMLQEGCFGNEACVVGMVNYNCQVMDLCHCLHPVFGVETPNKLTHATEAYFSMVTFFGYDPGILEAHNIPAVAQKTALLILLCAPKLHTDSRNFTEVRSVFAASVFPFAMSIFPPTDSWKQWCNQALKDAPPSRYLTYLGSIYGATSLAFILWYYSAAKFPYFEVVLHDVYIMSTIGLYEGTVEILEVNSLSKHFHLVTKHFLDWLYASSRSKTFLLNLLIVEVEASQQYLGLTKTVLRKVGISRQIMWEIAWVVRNSFSNTLQLHMDSFSLFMISHLSLVWALDKNSRSISGVFRIISNCIQEVEDQATEMEPHVFVLKFLPTGNRRPHRDPISIGLVRLGWPSSEFTAMSMILTAVYVKVLLQVMFECHKAGVFFHCHHDGLQALLVTKSTNSDHLLFHWEPGPLVASGYILLFYSGLAVVMFPIKSQTSANSEEYCCAQSSAECSFIIFLEEYFLHDMRLPWPSRRSVILFSKLDFATVLWHICYHCWCSEWNAGIHWQCMNFIHFCSEIIVGQGNTSACTLEMCCLDKDTSSFLVMDIAHMVGQEIIGHVTNGSLIICVARPHNQGCILCYDPGIEQSCVVCWTCQSSAELGVGNCGRILVWRPELRGSMKFWTLLQLLLAHELSRHAHRFSRPLLIHFRVTSATTQLGALRFTMADGLILWCGIVLLVRKGSWVALLWHIAWHEDTRRAEVYLLIMIYYEEGIPYAIYTVQRCLIVSMAGLKTRSFTGYVSFTTFRHVLLISWCFWNIIKLLVVKDWRRHASPGVVLWRIAWNLTLYVLAFTYTCLTLILEDKDLFFKEWGMS